VPIVVVFSLPFLYLLARRPVLRRLAFRNAARRPRETMLVLLGSMLGTAIITGSLVVGDTLSDSFQRAAYSHEGPIDELVVTTGVDNSAVRNALSTLRSPEVDGQLSFLRADASTLAGRKAEPHSQVVEVDFAAARAFGGDDPDTTGISGPTPGPGHAAITKDLARTLDVEAGARIVVSTFGHQLDVVVDRVLPRTGIAGFRLSPASEAPNVLVGPGTLAPLAATAPPGAPPPTAFVAVSNRGGVIDGAALTDRVLPQIHAALGDVPARVMPLKRDTIKDAKESGKQFTQLFAGIGFFSVLAGILLLVNIFVMLAEERKTELGMLRAMGLRRMGLVGTFSLEGWLYALASSALGALGGLALGRLIVAVAAGIFSNPGEVFSLELRYAAKASSIVSGFATGFLISLFTVLIASIWNSRLNVIRAIRDLPEPVKEPRWSLPRLALRALVFVAGVFVAMAGIGSEAPAAVLVGPALMAGGAVLVLRRWVPFRPLGTAAAMLVLVYSIAAFDLFPKAFADAQIPIFVVLGIILTTAAVGLVSLNQDTIGGVLRRVGGGSRNMSLRLGLAYPLARRFRTGMILGMYSLVVFTLVFMTVFSHLFAQQVEDFTAKVSGGFDLQVATNSSSPIPTSEMAALPGVAAVSAVSSSIAQFQQTCAKCDKTFKEWFASTFDATLLAEGPPALNARLPEFADDAAAYRALLTDPDAFIPSRFFLQTGGGPPGRTVQVGDTVVIKDPESGRVRDLHVIATAESGFGNLLAFISPQRMSELFGNRQSPDILFVKTRPGADADELATTINGRFVQHGADADSFRAIVAENLGQQKQFFRLIQGYLALGLLVGIAGLGVVMVRAVRERRRQIGVLRALGFEPAAVRRAFIAESAFVSFEGIVIGTVLALFTSWRLVGNDTFGATLAFSVPVGQLAVLTVGTFVASIIATATPAQQASRIKPAVALRIAD
jgi:putative ABC transport system permease protein